MPCDSVYLNEIKWQANTSVALLRKTLEEDGYIVQNYGAGLMFSHPRKNGTGTFQNGTMQLPSTWGDGADLKRGYSIQAVKESARKQGWTLKVDPKNKYKMKMVKRI
jgi:hypothetical protein